VDVAVGDRQLALRGKLDAGPVQHVYVHGTVSSA
jgi:hypothetical protein